MTAPEINRDEAMARADQHAQPEWKDLARRCIEWLARERRTFTSDDIWDALAEHYPNVQTHEHRALGPILLKATRDGLIRTQSCAACGTKKVMVASRRPEANCSDTPIYESLVYAPKQQVAS